MVKIETINVEGLHKKLKIKKTGKLAEEVFGRDVKVDYSEFGIVVRDKPLGVFLTILPDINKFVLNQKDYFNKTYEFAEKYETNFGGEVTLKTDYSKR